MTEETPPQATKKDQAVKAAKQAQDTLDNLGKTAEGVGSAFNAVKWVAIAISLGFVFGIGWMGYKIISAPAKAAANATQAVTDAVKSSAGSVANSTSDLINRLHIPSRNQAQTNALAETAFAKLNDMTSAPPETLKARTFWAANLRGHEGRVCQLSLDFGAGDVPILIAADNKTYAKSKSLGSKNNRLMRVIIRTQGDDLPLRVEWDEDASHWIMKWRSTTTKKPLEDDVAAERLHDILRGAQTC